MTFKKFSFGDVKEEEEENSSGGNSSFEFLSKERIRAKEFLGATFQNGWVRAKEP